MNRVNISKIIKYIMAYLMVFSFSTMIPFAECRGLERFAFINLFQRIGNIIAVVYICFWLLQLLVKRQYIPSKMGILIIGLNIYIAIITVMNGYSITKRGLLANLFMTLVFDMVLCRKDEVSFKGFIMALNTLLVINFISIILFEPSGGMARYSVEGTQKYYSYFLGYDNGHIVTLFPTICLNYILYLRSGKRKYIVFSALAIGGIVITFSATSMAMCLLFIVLYKLYIQSFTMRKALFDRRILLSVMLGTFTCFILLKGYNYFSNIFVYLFNKDVKRAREILYQTALYYIKYKWVFGYGYVVDSSWIHGYNSGHNVFLNYLLAGGIVCLIWFLIILYVSFAVINKQKKFSKESGVLITGIVAFILAGMTEGYDTYVSYYLFYWMCLFAANEEARDILLERYFQKRIVHFIVKRNLKLDALQ